KECGAGKYNAMPLSMISPGLPSVPASRQRLKEAMRGAGNSPNSDCAMAGTIVPDTRTIATPPRPGGVAAATMVSVDRIPAAAALVADGLRRRDAPVDVPLLRDGQQRVHHVVQHQARWEEGEGHRHHDRQDHH